MWNKYEERMKYKREFRGEAQKRALKRTVKHFFDNINQQLVKISNHDKEVRNQKLNILTKRSGKNTRPLANHQRYFMSLDDIKVGELVNFDEEEWVVLTSTFAKDVYYEGFLIRCNHVLEWLYQEWDEEVNAFQTKKASEHSAIYDTARFEEVTENLNITVPDSMKRIIIPNNFITSTIVRGKTTVAVDKSVYQINKIDSISQEGILYLIGEETQYQKSQFEIEEPEQIVPEEEPTTRVLVGPDDIAYGETNPYRMANYSYPVTWKIEKGEEFIEKTWTQGLRFYITLKNQGRMIGEEIVIRGTTPGNIAALKTIRISSIL